jgi:hypothetical protein
MSPKWMCGVERGQEVAPLTAKNLVKDVEPDGSGEQVRYQSREMFADAPLAEAGCRFMRRSSRRHKAVLASPVGTMPVVACDRARVSLCHC